MMEKWTKSLKTLNFQQLIYEEYSQMRIFFIPVLLTTLNIFSSTSLIFKQGCWKWSVMSWCHLQEIWICVYIYSLANYPGHEYK